MTDETTTPEPDETAGQPPDADQEDQRADGPDPAFDDTPDDDEAPLDGEPDDDDVDDENARLPADDPDQTPA